MLAPWIHGSFPIDFSEAGILPMDLEQQNATNLILYFS